MKNALKWILAVAALSSLGACAVVPAGPGYYGGPAYYGAPAYYGGPVVAPSVWIGGGYYRGGHGGGWGGRYHRW